MARKNRAAQAEISEIDRIVASLQQRKADLLAYMRVEGTVGKGDVLKQLPLLDENMASQPIAEKRSRSPSQTTLKVSTAARSAIEAAGPMKTKDLLRKLSPDVVAMLGESEEKQLQRLSQIMSREAKRGKFSINLKFGWSLRAPVVVPFSKSA